MNPSDGKMIEACIAGNVRKCIGMLYPDSGPATTIAPDALQAAVTAAVKAVQQTPACKASDPRPVPDENQQSMCCW